MQFNTIFLWFAFCFGQFWLLEVAGNGEEVLCATMQHRIQDMRREARRFCYSQARGPPEGVVSCYPVQRPPAIADFWETFRVEVCDQIMGSCLQGPHSYMSTTVSRSSERNGGLPKLPDETKKRNERTHGLLVPPFQQTAPCCKGELVSVLKAS